MLSQYVYKLSSTIDQFQLNYLIGSNAPNLNNLIFVAVLLLVSNFWILYLKRYVGLKSKFYKPILFFYSIILVLVLKLYILPLVIFNFINIVSLMPLSYEIFKDLFLPDKILATDPFSSYSFNNTDHVNSGDSLFMENNNNESTSTSSSSSVFPGPVQGDQSVPSDLIKVVNGKKYVHTALVKTYLSGHGESTGIPDMLSQADLRSRGYLTANELTILMIQSPQTKYADLTKFLTRTEINSLVVGNYDEDKFPISWKLAKEIISKHDPSSTNPEHYKWMESLLSDKITKLDDIKSPDLSDFTDTDEILAKIIERDKNNKNNI